MVSPDQREPDAPQDGKAEPVLILTPTGRDASVVVACLHEASIPTRNCHDIADFCAALDAAAAGLIAEEALPARALRLLISALKGQAAWSDVPLMILTTQATTSQAMRQFVQELGAVGNVTLLERPLYPFTLLSTIRAARQARRRQHEVRQLHHELERQLAEQRAVLEQLHKSETSLRHLNETLEQRVATRTAELEQQTQRLHQEMGERQRLQETLFEQEKLAALGTLLANVAHELNNPLAVATLQLDNLQEEGAFDACHEDLETLRQAVERCKSVVQSFLALARQQEPEYHAVALNAVIGDVLVLLDRALDVEGITLERHLADDLPPLWADANQLHHVVANLITNAHHALRESAPPRHLRLTTGATADHRQVILKVADSGPGIPQVLQHRIFDPFFTTKPQGVGSGLGLPLCRNIVEGHGGAIRLVSEPGHGTTVSVILPVAASDAQPLEAAPEPVDPVQRQSRAILLIDDEPAMQRVLKRLLQHHGHEVTTAANGQEGLSALEAHAYEVILCDMRMPTLDGPGFYRELERCHPHLVSRVIFLTGDVMSAEAEAFFARVDCPRLEKPFKVQEVQQVIEQVVGLGA